MTRFSYAILAACMVMGLAACNPATQTKEAPVAVSGPQGIMNVTWRLKALNQEVLADDIAVSLHMKDGGTMFGRGGCNQYSGRYELGDKTIHVNPAIVATMMACQDAAMKLEQRYHEMFTKVASWAINEAGELVLTTSDKRTLRFARQA